MQNNPSDSQDNAESFSDEPQFETCDNIIKNVVVNAPPKAATNEQLNNAAVVENKKRKNNAFNRRALSKYSKTYKVEKFEKKECHIFNNEHVKGKETRDGTEKDVDALKKSFKRLRFKVVEHKDKTKAEVLKILDELRLRDFTNHGCIAVAVLSHGNKNVIFASDGECFTVNDITSYLNPAENPTLVTTSIIIMIQACQNNPENVESDISSQPTLNQTCSNDAEIGVAVPAPQLLDHFDPNDVAYTLPKQADTLIVFSCSEGQRSHRNESYGTWFIQALCKNLDVMAPENHLLDIVVETQREVAFDMEDLQVNTHLLRVDTIKQMPAMVSTLTRKLYLNKYEGKPLPQHQKIDCPLDLAKTYENITQCIHQTEAILAEAKQSGDFVQKLSELHIELIKYKTVLNDIGSIGPQIRQKCEKDKKILKISANQLQKIEATLRNVPYKRQTSEEREELGLQEFDMLMQNMDTLNQLSTERLTSVELAVSSFIHFSNTSRRGHKLVDSVDKSNVVNLFES